MRRDALVSPLRLHNLRVPRGAILVFFAGLLEAAAAHTSFAPSPLLFLQKFASSRTETRHVAKLLSLRGAGEMSGDGPINTIAGTDALEWDDRISLQGKWTNAEKGWKVSVEWKQTPYGAGVFAAEDIPAGTVLRVGRNGLNQLHFRGVEDVEAFCRAGSDRSGTSDDAAYRSRLGYTKDYLYGFFPDTDERGYIDGSAREPDFVSMWIPGNGLNHNLEPNTVYRPAEGGAEEGINLESLCAVKCGEELVDDYRRHGKAPQWAVEWARGHAVTLNFAECNDFVLPKE